MAEKEDTTQTRISFLAQNAGALLVVAMLATVGGLMAYGTTNKVTNPWVIGCLVVGFAALAGWFVGRSQQKALPRDQYAKQRTLLGANALFSTLLFFLLLVGINYVAARRHKTWDLTSNKVNSLAEQTLKTLGELKAPVTLTYVFSPNTIRMAEPSPADKALLDKYKLASDNIRVKYINADAEPATLRELNLVGFSGQPTLLVQGESKGKDAKAGRQQIDTIDESNLTSALQKLGKNQARVLYYLTGHGELGFDGAGTSLGTARSRLEAQNYSIKALSLAKAGAKIPVDADLVVILGPSFDLDASEETILQKYLQGKGRLLLALKANETPMPRWKRLARLAGAEILSGFLIDPEQFAGQSPQVVYGPIVDPSKHPILGGVGENNNVIFPGAVPMKAVATTPGGLTVTTLLESSPSSQAVPFKRGGTVERGPFALSIASERGAAPSTPDAPSSTAQMRALLVCNANFGGEELFAQTSNGNFLLASVNWLAGNELLVSIPPKPPVTNTIDMTPGVRRFVNIFSLFTLPIIMLILGGLAWWRRR
jgi:ABC-type uncharacterized transport system involved in gliding motility auxiliary subunit